MFTQKNGPGSCTLFVVTSIKAGKETTVPYDLTFDVDHAITMGARLRSAGINDLRAVPMVAVGYRGSSMPMRVLQTTIEALAEKPLDENWGHLNRKRIQAFKDAVHDLVNEWLGLDGEYDSSKMWKSTSAPGECYLVDHKGKGHKFRLDFGIVEKVEERIALPGMGYRLTSLSEVLEGGLDEYVLSALVLRCFSPSKGFGEVSKATEFINDNRKQQLGWWAGIRHTRKSYFGEGGGGEPKGES